MTNNEQRATRYLPVIGLEVHVELKTNSKMFCACSADYFGKKPNILTCPVCLGLPGALPFPNKKAIEWCIMIGLALNCKIPSFSKFDRKNYFYPDLSKGYQISQYDLPFCEKGSIKLSSGKTIGITRVHMEEDTGKLIHEEIGGEKVSLIDFNRSGVPLVEIVTEPDFSSASEVKEYLQRLQQIVRYLGVSDANMERGDMRLEPNISLREIKKPCLSGRQEKSKIKNVLPPYKVEVKNINSFKFVEKAIKFEIRRQEEILENSERPRQETRGFVENGSKTVAQRSKEEASDYRYFPEPDIPPLRWTEKFITNLKRKMPELPEEKLTRFKKDYSLSNYDAELLTRSKELANFFEKAVTDGRKANINSKQIANYIINKKIDEKKPTPAEIVKNIAKSAKVTNISEDKLNKIIDEVISENEKAVNDYKSGKESAVMFLVGQVMRRFPDKIDALRVKETLAIKLK